MKYLLCVLIVMASFVECDKKDIEDVILAFDLLGHTLILNGDKVMTTIKSVVTFVSFTNEHVTLKASWEERNSEDLGKLHTFCNQWNAARTTKCYESNAIPTIEWTITLLRIADIVKLSKTLNKWSEEGNDFRANLRDRLDTIRIKELKAA
eukprot:NODE_9394_length_596_cov_27.088795_g8759_i0.p1 GENE.NODE_9394_length_596_cov_27.088795_g8759_i0~~NODE_9394_length_596_cov_27.088795_g8759_i0.p1  ORF type:complete len:151 (-),score=8.08 NODE_9394_length_596_cov_27.088795_g8759_i0:97-549(-)